MKTYKATARGLVVDEETETPIETTNPLTESKTNMEHPLLTTKPTAAPKGTPADEIKIEAKRIEPVVSDDHIQKMITVTLPNGEVKIISKTA